MYTLTITTDSREHEGYELPFPSHLKVYFRRSKTPTLIKIMSEVDKLFAGDYAIKGFESAVLVETKRSARELYENLLTDDWKRSSNAFERLSSSTKHPILVCEFGQADLLAVYVCPNAGIRLTDALAELCASQGFSIWFAGPRSGVVARRKTAECVLRLMIAAVEWEFPNFLRGEKGDNRREKVGG